MLKIGEKIKELRKSQDVTQEKLADYLNISYQAVSKWENGLALPDLSLIPALSNFFGVTSDYLLDISLDNVLLSVHKNKQLAYSFLLISEQVPQRCPPRHSYY